jgi:hypothetical protein
LRASKLAAGSGEAALFGSRDESPKLIEREGIQH